MCGFKNGIPSRYMNVNVGDELTIMANGLCMGSVGLKALTYRIVNNFNK